MTRPLTVRPEAIQRLEDEDDESGWAGEQEEVDFSAKLTWGDSDEEVESRKGGVGKESNRWRGQVSFWLRVTLDGEGKLIVLDCLVNAYGRVGGMVFP